MGLTVTALAQAVGATKSYISMIENQRVANPPSRRLLGVIEGVLGFTDGELAALADWNKTPPHVRTEFQRVAEVARRGEELARWLEQAATRQTHGARNLDEIYRSGELARRVENALGRGDEGVTAPPPAALASIAAHPLRYRVPLINRVAAGYPTDFSDLDYPARTADEYVNCPELVDPDAFAARVVGDSMLPDYREGDVVVFSPAADVTDGCDCFVRLEPLHETTFKRVFFESPYPAAEGSQVALAADAERIRLEPLNPRFAAAVYPREQVAGLYRAVWKFQRLG